MLTSLKIENYTLIKELNMSFSAHLNIITGETGAGKSIMLGAVGLLMGNRADTKVLSDTSRKCIIEGTFNITAYHLNIFFEKYNLDYEKSTIIRREITPQGKSRAFVNDTPVTLDILKLLSASLIDIHSQHDTLALADYSFQLSLVDSYADNSKGLDDFRAVYLDFTSLQTKIKDIENAINEDNNEKDYHQYLVDELTEANLNDTDQELLESELSTLENAEEIKTNLFTAQGLLTQGEMSIGTSLEEVRQHLRKVASLSENHQKLANRLESSIIELKDIAQEIENAAEQIVHDPERTATVKERLGVLYHLQQKHKVNDIQGLISIRDQLNDKLLQSSNLEEELVALKKQFNHIENTVNQKAKTLHDKRKSVFAPLTSQLEELLANVGMPDARINITAHPTPLSATGEDRISIDFSANKGVKPQSISQVASGGELSRLMFCVKSILAERKALPTVIFDEVDTGVSGEISLKMGKMMTNIADKHQVIAITHLPQIAATSTAHFHVYKSEENGKTTSNIRQLSKEEKIQEIATMIGGQSPSESAYNSAKELMKI